MNVASLELCRDLFELSGWDNHSEIGDWLPDQNGKYELRGGPWYNQYPRIPAYDLGYLLRKLPKNVTEFWGRAYPASPLLVYSGSSWVAYYHSEMTGEHNNDDALIQFAETPEDTACMLAIELFKQGVQPGQAPPQGGKL